MSISKPKTKSPGLFHNMAQNWDQCMNHWIEQDQPIFRDPATDGLYCNATWDTVLCWPVTEANTSASLQCPPLKGLDPNSFVYKECDPQGRWKPRPGEAYHPDKPQGWTDYKSCFSWGFHVLKNLSYDSVVKTGNGLERPQLNLKDGPTSQCQAQEIARGTRKLEFVGLGLSFLSLTMAVLIFCSFRRLRVFRNLVHLQLMLALLLVVIVRLILYVDLLVTEQLGNLKTTDVGATINTKPVICESFYFLLEYFKTVAFAWMFIEGFYLHNTVVVRVFSEEPRIWKYLLLGWGVPFLHTLFWLQVMFMTSGWKLERCLGSYYLMPEFWVLDGMRMLQLLINTFFLLNIMRVLWLKVRETHSATELEQLKKSVKAALMLVPLLGIPNIMQTIPFTPTKTNIEYFAVYTYIASIFYMFQGFMIATIYCFTNREVIHVLKSHYQRFRLQHTTSETLRRGSRAQSVHYQCSGRTVARNGTNNNNNGENRRMPTAPLLSKQPPLPTDYSTSKETLPPWTGNRQNQNNLNNFSVQPPPYSEALNNASHNHSFENDTTR